MKFKFGKNNFDFDVETTDTVLDVKRKLQELTGFDNIKLIHSGKVLTSDETLIASIPGGNNAKLTVMGTDPAVTSLLQQTITTTRVIDDLSDGPRITASHHKSTSHIATKHVKQSPYRFNNIDTLANLPNRERALDILTDLANDVGVLAVMEKHQWTVGTLCELYPEGYVGVSETCVMGLNTNKGQKIELRYSYYFTSCTSNHLTHVLLIPYHIRLRTDDLKGFRNVSSIKKVLYHELAHNVHSDHDDQFHILMRQIEREVSLLDWRTSKGTTTGYESRNSSHNNVIHDRGDSNYYNPSQQQQQGGVEGGGVHILGGGGVNDALLQQLLPARVLAGWVYNCKV
jgi:hypothetical protein